jgi:hypothetical protein
MTKIALAVLLPIGLIGSTAAKVAAREGDPHARMSAGAHGTEARVAVTAIKAIVNHSRFKVEVRNTENTHRLGNGADVPPITTSPAPAHPVDMWIPWAQTLSEFRTHHISVVLKDDHDRVVRRFAIWQRASFDGDWVRVGEARNVDDPAELPYAEPGTRIRPTSAVGGDRTLTVSVNGDLTLAAVR